MGFKEIKTSTFQRKDNQKTHTDSNTNGLLFLPQKMKSKLKKKTNTRNHKKPQKTIDLSQNSTEF